MWCIEAKAKINIPLGVNITEWTNQQFKSFIENKKTDCLEFKKAINWLGDKSYKEAIRNCENKIWLNWLQNNKPKDSTEEIKAGEKITITKGRCEKYALWHSTGIWDLPEEYVGETVNIISNS
jgi:hypothetical protein